METPGPSIKDLRILVVEDDPHLRQTIVDILTKLGGAVRSAENGLVAKTIIETNRADAAAAAKDATAAPTKDVFDLILSDIKMPAMNGIDLLKYCKEHTRSKFIIFTGFSELLETHTAAELGADEFLSKPFRLNDLVKIIDQLIKPADTAAPAAATPPPPTQAYCSVNVEEFFSTSRLVSDIYVKVREGKFIKLAKEGVEIEISRLNHFKEHKVAYLFVRTEDFHKYTGLNLKLAHALENSSVSAEKKMRLFRHTSEMLVQQILTSDFDKTLYDNACAMTENAVQAILQNDDLVDVLTALQVRGDRLYAHSVAVSVYACLVASKMGWGSVANQHKIALASLFHDVGFKELPEGLHEKPRFKMTPEETKLYESHTIRGREILSSIPGYPADLTMIVGQHHERGDRQGYPGGLSGLKTHPLARLIHFADEFMERVAAAQSTGTVHPKNILTEMVKDDPNNYDKQVLAGAFELLGLPVPDRSATAV